MPGMSTKTGFFTFFLPEGLRCAPYAVGRTEGQRGAAVETVFLSPSFCDHDPRRRVFLSDESDESILRRIVTTPRSARGARDETGARLWPRRSAAHSRETNSASSVKIESITYTIIYCAWYLHSNLVNLCLLFLRAHSFLLCHLFSSKIFLKSLRFLRFSKKYPKGRQALPHFFSAGRMAEC